MSTAARVVAALRELIAALDRRTPRTERPSEIRIAKEAALLRREAVTRIDELKCAEEDHACYNQELGEAIMTDDGAPVPSPPFQAGAATSRLEMRSDAERDRFRRATLEVVLTS